MVRRIVLIVLGILVALVAVVAIAAIVFVRSPFPDTDGKLTVVDAAVVQATFPNAGDQLEAAGLQAPVTVYRDEWGVPQIYADNAHDLFFAQGYVQSQDRLWQMDFQRRVGAGRLSEVLGDATLDTDRFLRTLGTYRAAQKDLAAADPETIAALEAYAQGVNAYIADHPNKLPLEFRILGYKPEPWQPLDSLVWGKMMAWSLGGNWETELMRARLVNLLGEEKAAQLLPFYPKDGPFIIPPEVKDYSALRGVDHDKVMAVKRLLKTDGEGIGSNNWVVAGKRSTTGMPLLANDPHLGMQMPSIWYESGLHGGGLDVVGVSLVGAPGVVIGHNNRIGWGMTNVGPDVQDLFIEKVNPDNPNQVEFQGAWEDVQVVEEPIKVKGQEQPVVETVRITRHGPIINGVVSSLGDQAEPLALRWTALDSGRLFDAILSVDRAQNWDEFRNALRDFMVPAQNFVYADVDGNIGYQMPGQIPIRAKGDGTVPVPGWTGDYEWTGYIPFDELPSVYNPEVGYVATANNQVVPDDYPYLISTEWSAPYRAARIVELIESKDKLSPDDFGAIQGDLHPLPTDHIVPLLDGLSFGDNKAAQQAVDLMHAWDREMDAVKPEPLIYAQFYQELVRATLGDELAATGDAKLVDDYLGDYGNYHNQAMEALVEDPSSAWWDDVSTPQVETMDQIVPAAFEKAVAALQASQGADPAKWQWGVVHYANFDHPLGAVQPLNRIFNKSIPARGYNYSVDAAATSYPDLVMNHGASFREILDLGNLPASRIVNTTGQSGQAFDKHYGDMIELWQNVGYHPMRFDRADIEQSAKDVLVLQPVGQ